MELASRDRRSRRISAQLSSCAQLQDWTLSPAGGGWAPHRWGYGEVLPRAYWAAPYLIADYWLFALEVPPAGYEWVRDDTDALLVNTSTGEILQVEYGAFA